MLCGREYFYRKGTGHTKTKCNSCSVNNRRAEYKRRSIAYKGGKCERCGYCKSPRALTFHHIDPKQKSFGLSCSATKSWESVKAELDKCILLCANCHMEEHEKLDFRTEESRSWEPKKPYTPPSDIPCECCGGKKSNARHVKLCRKCACAKLQKIAWPSNEEMRKRVWETPTSTLSKQLGVSDVAVAKHCKKHGIPKPPRGYWKSR